MFTVVAVTPPGLPAAAMAAAAARAGGLGILDCTVAAAGLLEEARRLAAAVPAGRWGIRVDAGHRHLLAELLALGPGHLLLAPDCQDRLPAFLDRCRDLAVEIAVECTSVAGAAGALAGGAHRVIARGHEGGGPVSAHGSWILLQQWAAAGIAPFWLRGGIGPHTVAACRPAGAHGVVLDAQLLLCRESPLAPHLQERLQREDGRRTVLLEGEDGACHRYLVLDNNATGVEELAATDPARRARARQLLLAGADGKPAVLEAGQDVGLAPPLAHRHLSVAGVVQAVARAAVDHLELGATQDPWGASGPLARGLGLASAVVQGPMARVSDTPAFLAAVADNGATPFLAAAWTSPELLHRQLATTKQLMGKRPWGVGLLGFLPAQVYGDQERVVLEHRPPFALIAGGQASQVQRLEEAGIKTFVHVPTVSLLEMFLDAGCRRFVFEGREAGGHVGPFCCLPLWEQMAAHLLAWGERHPLAEVQVLLAGGIRDRLSSAMAAVLAAPLLAAGAGVGLQLGSAYLFTDEAVATGAITRRYRDELLACRTTTLLESAPGHAVRCAPTPFTGRFQAERQRLLAAGMAPAALRRALEALERGRLRIAAKGCDRRGDDGCLVPLPEEDQHREGIFMVGEVAALQDRPLTMAALHRELVAEGRRLLAPYRRRRRRGRRRRRTGCDIAIVGLGGFVPGAPDLAGYWQNILDNRVVIREIPEERWPWPRLFHPDRDTADRIYAKWGTFLPDIPFDPLRYGMVPRSVPSVEPLHLLALEASRLALEDAGYHRRPFDRERTSVVMGISGAGDLAQLYGFRTLLPIFFGEAGGQLQRYFADHLPQWTEDSFPGILMNVASGRIANRFDFGGMNTLVDGACASSLAAVYTAVRELAAGRCDLALAGGADTMQGPFTYMCFAKTQALSPRGACHPLAADADGIVIGEAVVVAVLKRLADARRDGDQIYAVIKGMGASSDGRDRSLTAPGIRGQKRALARAYEDAGVDPATVDLFEMHATGTVAGDRAELTSLTQFLKEHDAGVRRAAVGSVKSQIGHTKSAAGLASLAKVALALRHRVLPPTAGVAEPNPALLAADCPLYPNTVARPWFRHGKTPRRAGISAFGFGGTNYHAVLEEDDDPLAPPPAPSFQEPPLATFWFSGADQGELAAHLSRWQERLAANPAMSLGELELVNQQEIDEERPAGPAPWRLAILAEDHDQLRTRLDEARAVVRAGEERLAGNTVLLGRGTPAGKVAFLFPGQGSQYPGMLAAAAIQFPRVHAIFAMADRVLDRPLTATIFPPPPLTPEEGKAQARDLAATDAAQPALGAAALAVFSLLQASGVHPDMAGGHSYGEYAALACAGALGDEDLIRLSLARARAILAGGPDPPGTMAAVAAGGEQVEEYIAGLAEVWPANHNSPRQTVITGTEAGIRQAVARCGAAGVTARPIPVACAFHSPLMAGAQPLLAAALAEVDLAAPRIPVYANLTGRPHTGVAAIRAALVDHLTAPVRFMDMIRAMADDGARCFIECGPGRVLTGLVGQILDDRPHLALATDHKGSSTLAVLATTLSILFAWGLPVTRTVLLAGRQRRPEVQITPTTWLVNGSGCRPADQPARGAPEPYPLGPDRQPPPPLPAVPPPAAAATAMAPAGATTEAMVAFQRLMQRFLTTQERVMGWYLGERDRGTKAPAGEGSRDTAAVPEVRDPEEHRAPATEDAERQGMTPGGLGRCLRVVEELGEVITTPERLQVPGWLLVVDTGDDRGLAAELAGGGVQVVRMRLDGPAGDPGVVAFRRDPALAAELRAAHGPAGGIVYLVPPPAADCPAWLEQGCRPLFHLLQWFADDVQRPGGLVAVVTAMGGTLGLGDGATSGSGPAVFSGWLKSLALEWPQTRVRLVDANGDWDPRAVAAELAREEGPLEVGLAGGRRYALGLRLAPLAETEPPAWLTTPGAVIVLTGGGRGITAGIAVALARVARQATLVLVGRTEPTGDDPFPEAEDPPALKRAVLAAANPPASPAAVERRVREILAGRELRRTMAMIGAAGGRPVYRRLDLAQPGAMGGLLAEVHATYGRLDLLVHGAGIIEDKLLKDKTWDSFARVLRTKMVPCWELAHLDEDHLPAHTVLFGSVAGVFGNRGQCDYAGANEVVSRTAAHLARRNRWAAALHWGPWAGSGMASPAVAAQFQRRGVALVEPAAGQQALLAELAAGDRSDRLLGNGPWLEVAARASLPFLAVAGEEPERVTLEPAVHRYLDHHRLDGRPVLPAAAAVELMAEAGQRLRPAAPVAAVTGVRVLQGVRLATDNGMELFVRSTDDGPEVAVELADASGRPRYRGTVVLGTPPVMAPLDPGPLAPLAVPVKELYENYLFHGPLFQCIREVAGMGEAGMAATLVTVPAGDCLAGAGHRTWLLDPVLLDGGLQLALLWARLRHGITVLPNGFAGVYRYRPMEPGRPYRCLMRVDEVVNRETFVFSMDFRDEDEQPVARIHRVEASGSQSLNRLAGKERL